MSYSMIETQPSKDECSSCGIIIGTLKTKHVCYFCKNIMCNECKDYRPGNQQAQKICRPCKEEYMLQKIPKSLHKRYSELENLEKQKIYEIDQQKNANLECLQSLAETKQQVKEIKEENQKLRIRKINDESDFKDRQIKMLLQIDTMTQTLSSYNEVVIQKQNEMQEMSRENKSLQEQIKEYKEQIQALNEKLKVEKVCSAEIEDELSQYKEAMSRRTSSMYSIVQDNKEFNKEEEQESENEPANTCCSKR